MAGDPWLSAQSRLRAELDQNVGSVLGMQVGLVYGGLTVILPVWADSFLFVCFCGFFLPCCKHCYISPHGLFRVSSTQFLNNLLSRVLRLQCLGADREKRSQESQHSLHKFTLSSPFSLCHGPQLSVPHPTGAETLQLPSSEHRS